MTHEEEVYRSLGAAALVLLLYSTPILAIAHDARKASPDGRQPLISAIQGAVRDTLVYDGQCSDGLFQFTFTDTSHSAITCLLSCNFPWLSSGANPLVLRGSDRNSSNRILMGTSIGCDNCYMFFWVDPPFSDTLRGVRGYINGRYNSDFVAIRRRP